MKVVILMGRWKGATLLSLALAATGIPGLASAADAPTPVAAALETPSYFDDDAGGNANADDPAVWVDRDNPGQSLVAATLKEGGLDVFDMSGNVVQHIAAPPAPGEGDEVGRFNNVDIVQGARIGDRRLDIAVVSDRGRDLIRTYAIDGDSSQPLTEITAADVPFAFSSSQAEVNDQFTAYGLTAFRDPDTGGVLVAASQRHRSTIGLFRLTAAGSQVSYTKAGTVDLPSEFTLPDGSTWSSCEEPGETPQIEGMVFDRDQGTLYAAQEQVGLWEISLDGSQVEDTELFEKVKEFGVPWTFDPEADEECTVHYDQDPGYGGEHIAADAEGLTMYYTDDEDNGYLLSSSQGDNSFAVFDRQPGDHDYNGSFVASFEGDTVEHSDGSTVVNVPLGADFPEGAFIAHDGHDTPDETDDNGELRERTNFKFVPWQNIADPLDLEIETD